MMFTIRAGKRALSVCLLLVAAACSREQQDWRTAEAADSITSYGEFIQRHPESELASQARTRVAQLGEDNDWKHAGSADTADAYRQFITQHPNGKWAQEARIRIESFSLGAQPGGGSHAPFRAGSSSPPVAVPGEAAVPAASAPPQALPPQTALAPALESRSPVTGYGIQLGAFSTEAAAVSEWRSLTARFGQELQGLAPVVAPSGTVYRLQASVSDEARARALCDILKKRGQGCVPVLPH